MGKSIVGDPVFWPGLIYAPLNVPGLIFALGSISNITGLIFEEFSDSGRAAVCRRRTERGWERIKAALAVRSSEYEKISDDIDLLICWIDDSSHENKPPILELSGIDPSRRKGHREADEGNDGHDGGTSPADSDDCEVSEDTAYREFEQTIRLLDDKIRKFKAG